MMLALQWPAQLARRRPVKREVSARATYFGIFPLAA